MHSTALIPVILSAADYRRSLITITHAAINSGVPLFDLLRTLESSATAVEEVWRASDESKPESAHPLACFGPKVL